MENYIRNQLVSHFRKHQIEISDKDILSIIDQTKKGVYAFQIIYVDNHKIVDQETGIINLNLPTYKFKLLKLLNRSNIEYNKEYDIWSYDGGKTFSEWVNYLGGKSVNGNAVIFPYSYSVPYHLYWKVGIFPSSTHLHSIIAQLAIGRDSVLSYEIHNETTWPRPSQVGECIEQRHVAAPYGWIYTACEKSHLSIKLHTGNDSLKCRGCNQ